MIALPTQDEFDSWQLHPVSQYVAEAYRIAAEKQREAWSGQFDKPLYPTNSDFSYYRLELKTREDAYRSILENTLSDYIAIVAAPRSGFAPKPAAHAIRAAIAASRRSPKPTSGGFNLGKIGEARLDLVPSLEDCNPGFRPTEYNVLVAPAPVSDTMGALGLIKRTDQDIETEELAMQVGRIIALSPLAFGYERWPEEAAHHWKPKVGDIVWIARYAGGLIERAFDGRSYRLIKDKDVGAVFDPLPPGKVWELEPG